MKNEISKRKSFDYNGLPDNQTRAFLKKKAEFGKAILKRTASNIWDMGELLTEVKAKINHGDFGLWIEAEFGVSSDTAANFMNVYKNFENPKSSDFELAPSVLYLLAKPSVSDEVREIAIELAASGDLKTKEDAKALIQASNPIQNPKSSDFANEQYPTDEPENESEYEAIPVEEEDDFPDPFDDEVEEPEVEIEADQQPVSKPVQPIKNETLKDRVKNAEVFHDTLSKAVKPEELSEKDWLQSLPIFRVLSQKQHRGIFLKRDLLAARQLEEQQKLFAHHARRAVDFKAPSGTYYTKAVIALASMPAPIDWQICSPCKGNGCQRCAHAGYDTSGAGISPLRVENGEVIL